MNRRYFLIVLYCLLMLFSCRKKEIIEVQPAPDLTWKHFGIEDFKGDEAIIRNLNTNDGYLWVSSNNYLGKYDMQGSRIEVLDNINREDNPGYENAISDNYYGYIANFGNGAAGIYIYNLTGSEVGDYNVYVPLYSIDSAFYKIELQHQNGVFSSQDVFLSSFASTKDNHPHLVFVRMNSNYYISSKRTVVLSEETSNNLNVIRSVKDYFLISAQNGTYKADSSGGYHKVSANSFVDFFIYHDTCFADRGDWIYYSADQGESWQIYAQYSQTFPGRKFFVVDDRLYFFSLDKIYRLKNFSSFVFEPVDNAHLEGDIITSIIQFGQRIYAGTNNGVYYKNISEF